MSFNKSKRQILSAALAAPIKGWNGGRLVLRCNRCGQARVVPVSSLCDGPHGDQTLGWVVHRLRCLGAGCGAAPSYARLDGPLDTGSTRPLTSLLLIGPGAYA